jgi:hypothetical protein
LCGVDIRGKKSMKNSQSISSMEGPDWNLSYWSQVGVSGNHEKVAKEPLKGFEVEESGFFEASDL